MKLSFSLLFSPALLLNRSFLWLLFIVNFAGTIYGYIWYENQLIWTIEQKESWMLPFVPDSPTASLFFSISVLFLLFPPKGTNVIVSSIVRFINALAVVCSFKYGIWATAVIIAGAAQGDPLNWQSYMLMTSHIAMAVEVMLYARFMKLSLASFVAATAWLLLNDTMDYTFGIYPWLPSTLHSHVDTVMILTYLLSICSLIVGLISWKLFRKQA
ncbi:DUF1405 domain-containing protein [Paenibacillus camelliae]|uniref:DUF1405 domain-containing protein n=1 Tax=Paenibacillus camelliae TaxID=512410 RepID=UPI00203D72D6|nr:DUF1405 domain-containing protein [Paenibacillus camelliae]MCM3633043.1 DUF1405 domain-containing protein [Paenibacillus camelliae]